MTNLLETIETADLTTFAGVASAVGAVFCSKKFRNSAAAPIKATVSFVQRINAMETSLGTIVENQKHISTRMEAVSYELNTNGGGSVKDAVMRIEESVQMLSSRDFLRFRSLPYAGFECLASGENVRVTDKYLELLELKANQDLSKLDWVQFIHPDCIELYLANFLRCSENDSDFGHVARMFTANRVDIGEWLIKASRLSNGSYLGRLYPFSDKAKEVSQSLKLSDD